MATAQPTAQPTAPPTAQPTSLPTTDCSAPMEWMDFGDGGINSAADLAANHWSYSVGMEWNYYNHDHSPNTLSFFVSGDPVGCLFRELPAGYNTAIVRWGAAHAGSGSVRLKIGGQVIETVLGDFNGDKLVTTTVTYSEGDEIRIEELDTCVAVVAWIRLCSTPA